MNVELNSQRFPWEVSSVQQATDSEGSGKLLISCAEFILNALPEKWRERFYDEAPGEPYILVAFHVKPGDLVSVSNR